MTPSPLRTHVAGWQHQLGQRCRLGGDETRRTGGRCLPMEGRKTRSETDGRTPAKREAPVSDHRDPASAVETRSG